MIKFLFSFVFVVISVLGISQNALKPVSWKVNYVPKTATEGELVYTAIIDHKWHIYSQRPTDAGPIPTSFTITPNANFELVGKVEESNAHEEYVAAFDAKMYVFENTATFHQKIKLKNKKPFVVESSLEYMTCNDKQCLPPETVSLTVNISAEKK